MSSLPHYITQDDQPESVTMTEQETPPVQDTELVHPSSGRSNTSVPAKKLVQVDFFGRKVCPSKMKVKVRSYNRNNGTRVRKYSRKQSSGPTKKTRSAPLSFKKLMSTTSCKDSVDLAHSLYIDELRASIRSVGKSNITNNK